MRGAFRRQQREEEEESVFVSMTDMTVSFLFITMILLAFFASRFNPKESVPKVDYDRVARERYDIAVQLVSAKAKIAALEAEVERLMAKLREKDPLEEYLTRTSNERRKILQKLQDQIKVDFPDLQVVISEENDALRFQGDGLFQSSQSVLRPERKAIVEAIASRLETILPCYTLGSKSTWSDGCNTGSAIIEAVQIEGHTDSTGDDIGNLRLSTDRANSTFIAMTGREPGLVGHLNFKGQPVLSVAGYGKMRPVAGNDTSAGRATNRRIDLRIIMYTPSRSGEIENIRKSLRSGLVVEGR
ncbi:OmpA family protein [Bradyrhizobium sp. U87765 SZCCT0131]|uniref:OmpA/MotB family protein n=1 Tax=unclassified Bradyrhizobium TaxID=2631580 RepID=UPI001BA9B8A2|nr:MULTISPECIES: OmpA family protein [unclassified Bradyrhizobium]MBR1216414.1 OmpA family protein [Bradyrhizobium sp. U87765 SZCCT0131]MBR1259838.1 OmpA family protein [Bradyrhizobium sp. U87765 SZCCT0134]MBR1305971.1 OmpA family protein [Bradyrhizobium sp. U87765 SZCCT0110]MBR1322338.1 OmpA family protein [Bradyrhizobium sp. U87765 SZCCT0109]MBR1352371.1 OmpA family protein [Bradyrhizobium sp. U87765 SZCCT0048]